MKRNSVMRVTQLALLALCGVCHAGDDFFSVPDFKALPPDVQVVSEKTEEGVRVTEMFFAGAPFNGQPTRIYGFYCRPEKDGKYPGVLEIHGNGLKTLGPGAGIEYAKNGFCCFVMDWAGKMGEYYRKVPRRPPYSEFEAAGKMLRFLTEEEKKQTHPVKTGLRLIDPAADSIRNGVLFARRAAMLLKSRPEVDPDKLCVSGMSAGGHLTLLILGVEPSFKVAAVKYGNAFIRDLPDYFGSSRSARRRHRMPGWPVSIRSTTSAHIAPMC